MTGQLSHQEIEQLLKRLESKQDDDVARTTLFGRALSRSDDSLHLAVKTGIVAIPIANIERVIAVPSSRPDVIRVVVRNSGDIRRLFEVQPRPPSVARLNEGDVVPGEVVGGEMAGVATCVYNDTATITGGEADQSDDVNANCPDDDTAQ